MPECESLPDQVATVPANTRLFPTHKVDHRSHFPPFDKRKRIGVCFGPVGSQFAHKYAAMEARQPTLDRVNSHAIVAGIPETERLTVITGDGVPAAGLGTGGIRVCGSLRSPSVAATREDAGSSVATLSGTTLPLRTGGPIRTIISVWKTFRSFRCSLSRTRRSPRRLTTLEEVREYVGEAMRLRRPAPWRELWHRLKAVASEDEAIEAIGDLRELLAEEDVLLPEGGTWRSGLSHIQRTNAAYLIHASLDPCRSGEWRVVTVTSNRRWTCLDACLLRNEYRDYCAESLSGPFE